MKIVKIVLAIFIPPIAAVMQVGVTTHFWINIILTLLGGVPGIVHALWLVITDRTQ
ncbi:MAG: YqaE/Pmp3 family membrane protein [Bythopirellula sp.]